MNDVNEYIKTLIFEFIANEAKVPETDSLQEIQILINREWMEFWSDFANREHNEKNGYYQKKMYGLTEAKSLLIPRDRLNKFNSVTVCKYLKYADDVIFETIAIVSKGNVNITSIVKNFMANYNLNISREFVVLVTRLWSEVTTALANSK